MTNAWVRPVGGASAPAGPVAVHVVVTEASRDDHGACWCIQSIWTEEAVAQQEAERLVAEGTYCSAWVESWELRSAEVLLDLHPPPSTGLLRVPQPGWEVVTGRGGE